MPNIPFEIILVILFFVLPAVGNVLRRRGEAQGQENRPTPTRPSRSSQSDTAAPSTAPQDAPKTPSGSPDWLEEARRRVAEARRQEAEAQPRRTRGQTPNTPPVASQQTPSRPRTPRENAPPSSQHSLAGRSLEDRSAEQRTVRQSLERGSLERPSLESERPKYTSLEGTSLERPALGAGSTLANLTEAPPLRTQRLSGPKRATITKQELRFDAHDLAKGLIWHQVLSPPRSTLRRTRLSRRRP